MKGTLISFVFVVALIFLLQKNYEGNQEKAQEATLMPTMTPTKVPTHLPQDYAQWCCIPESLKEDVFKIYVRDMVTECLNHDFPIAECQCHKFNVIELKHLPNDAQFHEIVIHCRNTY